MAIQGYTFDDQVVTPEADAITYEHNTDGIMRGCAMSITASSFTISSGHWIQGGRRGRLTSAYVYTLPSGTATGYIRIKSVIDLSKVATETEFEQISFAAESSATTTFPALIQQDINGGGGTTYEMAWAILQVSGGSITNLTQITQPSSLQSDGGISTKGAAKFPTIYLIDESGNVKGRFYYNSSGIYVATGDTSGTIFLRPNGLSSASGQTYISPNGDLIASGNIAGRHLYLRDANGNNLGELRGAAGLYISNENSGGGSIYLRPNGTNSADGQFVVAPDGTVTFSGAVTSGGVVSAAKSGQFASLYLYDGSNVAGRLSANSTDGVYLSYQPLPDAGASGKPIRIRPNGLNSNIGQFVVNADGSVSTSGSIDIDGTASIDQVLFLRDPATAGTLWGRVYATSTNLILSHETGSGGVIIRPKGLNQAGTSVTVDNDANVTASGSVTAGGAVTAGGNVSASKSGSFASLYLYDGSNVAGRVSSNSTQGTFITSQPATGSTTGQPIYLRPNGIGSSTGQVYVDTNGVINGTFYSVVSPATGINVFRFGNFRVVRVYMDVNSIAAGSNTLSGTLAAADRPTQDTPGPASFRNANTIIAHGSIMIGSSGTVRAISSAARSATTTIEGIAVYPVA